MGDIAEQRMMSLGHSKTPFRRPFKPSTLVNISNNPYRHNNNRVVIKNQNHHKNKNKNNNNNNSVSDVLRLMDSLAISTPKDIYNSLVKECIVTGDISGAKALHKHVIARNRLDKPSDNIYSLNRLLVLHVSLHRLEVARQLFDQMPFKDLESWAVMIVAYVDRHKYEEALSLFIDMFYDDDVIVWKFPEWMMACFLKICAKNDNVDLGIQLHGCFLKLGCLQINSFLNRCLIEFYGNLTMERLSNKSRERMFLEVLYDFNEIGKTGVSKTTSMFSIVLKACSRVGDDGKCGRQVHGNAIKTGYESDLYVQCGLVSMYGKNGLIGDAKRAFEISGDGKNNACWNAMLGGYISNGFYSEAMRLVFEMNRFGVKPQQSLLRQLAIARGSNCQDH